MVMQCPVVVVVVVETISSKVLISQDIGIYPDNPAPEPGASTAVHLGPGVRDTLPGGPGRQNVGGATGGPPAEAQSREIARSKNFAG